MGFLDQLRSMMTPTGGTDPLQGYAAGQGDFSRPDSADAQNVQRMVANAPPDALQHAFSHAATQMDPQEYSDHITPGVGGTNPLGMLGAGGMSGAGGTSGGGLATIATVLMSKLTSSGGGYNAQSVLSHVPGLQTADPYQMDANDVAALSRYTQQNHPELFGQAAAQIGQQQPSLLHSFLGKAGLALAAAALASRFIKLDKH